MTITLKQVIEKMIENPIFTITELQASMEGNNSTNHSITGLLSSAVKTKDLNILTEGIYCLPKKHRSRILSPYELLKKMDNLAYVTDLTALSYFDLIPEAIGLISVQSEKIISGQKPFRTDLGTFQFLKVSPHVLSFGVDNINLKGGISYRMATPLKAILDHAFNTQKSWNSRAALIHDLRLDEENFDKIRWNDLDEYKNKYNHPFIKQVCENLNQ